MEDKKEQTVKFKDEPKDKHDDYFMRLALANGKNQEKNIKRWGLEGAEVGDKYAYVVKYIEEEHDGKVFYLTLEKI